MKKRLISLSLALIMLLTLAPVAFAEDADEINIDLTTVTDSVEGLYDIKTESDAKILTLTGKDKTYVLTGTWTGHVLTSVDCTIVLKGATIDATASSHSRTTKITTVNSTSKMATAALSIEEGANAELVLAENSENVIKVKSSNKAAGIYVENVYVSESVNYISTLTISGEGALNVSGGTQSAAIGGAMNFPTGNINIEGGTINATAGTWAPAIGDGDSQSNHGYTTWTCTNMALRNDDAYTCLPATINITGGNITAIAGHATPGIGSSDELSTYKNGGGAGYDDRIWKGLTIHISGGNILTVGGGLDKVESHLSYSALGGGKLTTMESHSVTVDEGVLMLAVTYPQSHPLNSDGNNYENPSINDQSSANVLSVKYDPKTNISNIEIRKIVDGEQTKIEALETMLNKVAALNTSGDTEETIGGFAVALPDGTYHINLGSGSTVILEGGGLVTTNSGDSIHSVQLKIMVDGVESSISEIGKKFRIKDTTDTDGNYITMGAVPVGTYTLHELYADDTYSDVLSPIELPGDDPVFSTDNTFTIETDTASPYVITLYYYSTTYTYPDPEDPDELITIPGYTIYDPAVDAEEGPGRGEPTPPTIPEKDGYTGTWVEVLDEEDRPIMGEYTLEYTPNEYTVAFHANGGAGSIPAQLFVYDADPKALTANSFTRDGHIFKGWSTTENPAVYTGTTASDKTWDYNDEELVQNLVTENNGNLDLYAVWEAHAALDYSVTIEYTYTPDGGTSISLDESIREDEAVVYLTRKSGSDTNFTRFNNGDSDYFVTVDFDILTNPSSTVARSFAGLPRTDENGNLYTYRIETTVPRYYSDYTNNLNLTLKYIPVVLNLDFEVELESDLQPEEIYVKVLSDNGTNRGVIAQHTNNYIILTEDDLDEGVYSGTIQFPLNSNHYQIKVIGYKLEDSKPFWFSDDELGAFKLTHEYDEDAAVTEDLDNWTTAKEEAGSTGTYSCTFTVAATLSDWGISYDLKGGTISNDAPSSYQFGVGLETLPTPTRVAYRFTGWQYLDENSELQDIDSIPTDATGDYALIATWKWSPSSDLTKPPVDNPKPTVISTKPTTDGGEVIIDTKPNAKPGDDIDFTTKPDDDKKVIDVIAKDKDGNPVEIINNGDGSFTIVGPETDVSLEVVFGELSELVAPSVTGVGTQLEAVKHIAYINGYPDGSVRPESNMTRAEAAQMYYNLLLNKSSNASARFDDVAEDAWYADAVITLSSKGIINGYDGNFYPDAPITRAEFATMAIRFAVATGGNAEFSDVTDGQWAYDYIMTAAGYGWINGYSDGTFRPDNNITRAEVATIVNHMLYRAADKSFVSKNVADLKDFSDLKNASEWFYYDMVEATNAHDYERDTKTSETWSKLR